MAEEPEFRSWTVRQLQDLAAGQSSAWDSAFRLLHRLIVHVLREFGVPRDDLDDVSQLVWLKAFRGRESLLAKVQSQGASPAKLFRWWLVVISERAAIDYHRKRVRRAIEIDSESANLPVIPREIARLAVDLLDELTDEEEDLILLRLSGFTLEEVAAQRQTSVATIHRRLASVRKKLDRDLE